MGTRHQAWVIARVKPHPSSKSPPRYRCIAAVHQQWEDRRPHCMYRFLNLVRQKENAEVVRAELRSIEGQYGPFKDASPIVPEAPCPYISFLLGIAWKIDLEQKTTYMWHSGGMFSNGIVHAKHGCWDIDNNDGISVIDVTDPEHPKYCFVREGYAPLSATAYDDAYWVRGHGNAEFTQGCVLVEDLGLDMITAETLVEAFDDRHLSAEPQREIGHIGPEDDATAHGISSLVDLTFDVALAHSVTTEDTVAFNFALGLPGNAARAKEFFLRQSPFPEHGVPLLALVLDQLGESFSIDLSGFDILPEQLLQLLAAQKNTGVAVRALNISHNSRITAKTVRDILAMFPAMERLLLMDCSAVEIDSLRELIRTQPTLFYHMKALLHPLFVTIPLKTPPAYPVSFSFFSTCEGRYSGADNVRGCSLPFMSLDVIVQTLTDYFHAVNYCQAGGRLYYMREDCGILASAAFTGVHSPDTKWGNRSVAFVPGLSPDALVGDKGGWAFAWDLQFSMRSFTTVQEAREWVGTWAFLRLGDKGHEGYTLDSSTRPCSAVEIHDLNSFLQITTAEGRPAPSADAVQTLQDTLSPKWHDGSQHALKYTLMSKEQLETVWEEVTEYANNPRAYV